MLVSRGLERVLGDLTALGYDAKWTVMGAADVGANHQRDRIWIVGKVGNANNNGQVATKIATSLAERSNTSKTWQEQASKSARPSKQYAELAYTDSTHGERNQCAKRTQAEHTNINGTSELAYTSSIGLQGSNKCGSHEQSSSKGIQSEFARSYGSVSGWWKAEPNVGRVADGVAARVDRLKAIGNGQVPLCAATAWKVLTA